MTANYQPGTGFAGSTGTLARIINRASGTGMFLTLSPAQKQDLDKVLMEATVSPAAGADTVTFMIGTTPLGSPVPVVNGKASGMVPVLAVPGTKVVTAVFNSSNYTVPNVTKTMTILKEDARVTYMKPGATTDTLCLCGATQVAITVTVKDMTAVDAALDPDAGDIRNRDGPVR